MKRWLIIIGLALFAIFAVGDLIHDFIANEPIHFFVEKPGRLLWVLAIASVGGLFAWIFSRLTARLKLMVKLVAVGLAAGCFTVVCGYLVFEMGSLSLELGVLPCISFLADLAIPFGGAGLLWYEFCREYRSYATSSRPVGPD